ncbi:MAG: cytochrome C [Campylobacterota bacterium]
MKKLVLTAVTVGLLAVGASADADVGQKVYSQVFKDKCQMSGTKFAAAHSQDEWQEIMDAGNFGSQMAAMCPDVQTVPQKFQKHLFDFAYKYANDSGNVPSC